MELCVKMDAHFLIVALGAGMLDFTALLGRLISIPGWSGVQLMFIQITGRLCGVPFIKTHMGVKPHGRHAVA